MKSSRKTFAGEVPSTSLRAGSRAMRTKPEPLLVVILGPTGSGKTALSLALAERGVVPGEIVNCDSEIGRAHV